LLAAQDVAGDTLIDAERLAVALLAAAEGQAADIVARARREASRAPIDEHASPDVLESRHHEVLAELAECRRELHRLLEAVRPHDAGVSSADPPSDGRGLPAALSVKVQGRRLPVPPPAPPGTRSRESDDEFSAALFRAVAGVEPLDPSWWDDDHATKIATATTGSPGRRAPQLRPPRTSQAGVVVTLASRRPC